MTAAPLLFAERTSVEQVELGNELAPRFDAAGLLPAIVVDAASSQILMLGQMNPDALERTIVTRQAHFWSRSRQALWRKGEHSGFTQTVERMLVDDDQDAVILLVRVEGPGSCHVGFRSCFYREVDLDSHMRPSRLLRTETEPAFDAAAVYAGLPNPTKL
ncbi:phosphoribosyl-AMP cyclohydrolase [Tsuneonella sp. CC-YZS046]|uniref:phosphoribosyl-AMP cyclohydrolase n=1 Tax=Tsuneonella sp. CC-YZS046 TaxID=3042152 RepID=UPI002D77A0FB|nr:phosphoribosyl-AMP cyclohydrolase [Tsuneonella sp. CC-YZS046]WRO67388.1 phosphoribosyl-AMP cyclohydrolase [Tsuneonella sp. CC-YZS046]